MPSTSSAASSSSPQKTRNASANSRRKSSGTAASSPPRTLKRLSSAGTRLDPPIPTEEDLAVRAAELILSADFFLVAGGAGFSADSGLPVYKDIADVPAYRRMDVSYADLCVPQWLRRDPEIFYGFWGSCFNDYMDTEPHQGYHIIKKWADTLCQDDSASRPAMERRNSARDRVSSKQRLTSDSSDASRPSTAGAPMSRPGTAQRSLVSSRGGARERWRSNVQEKRRKLFVYTSNVDTAFERVGLGSHRIYEIHGNVVRWQCGTPCCDKTWQLTDEHRFDVEKETMRAPRYSSTTVHVPDPPAPPAARPARAQEGGPAECGEAEAGTVMAEDRGEELHARNLAEGLGRMALGATSATGTDGQRAAGGKGKGGESALPSGGGMMAVRQLHRSLNKRISLSPYQDQVFHHHGAAAIPPMSSMSEAGAATRRALEQGEQGMESRQRQVEFKFNHIKCQECGRLARPNVLMFEDEDWVEREEGERRYKAWEEAAVSALKLRTGKVVVLEGGCGKRVPTVRNNSHRLVNAGASLVRINVDWPSYNKAPSQTVPFRSPVLRALTQIDAAIARILEAPTALQPVPPPSASGVPPSLRKSTSFAGRPPPGPAGGGRPSPPAILGASLAQTQGAGSEMLKV